MKFPWPPALGLESEETAHSVVITTRRLIAVAGLVLMAATWKLWFAPESFPQVPLVQWVSWVPAWYDILLGALMAASLLMLFSFPRKEYLAQTATLVFVGGFWEAVIVNQHHSQPWAYEFSLLLFVMAVFPASRSVPAMKVLIISIYWHSGWSKLDWSFLNTHGEQLLKVITDALGLQFSEASPLVRQLLVSLLPIGEIAVAVGLCFRKTQRPAVFYASIMHMMLLWILGPWGLDHQPGVLIWNGFFLLQNLVLFRPFSSSVSESQIEAELSETKGKRYLGIGVLAFAVMWPFLEPFGYCDHWPAWAVYASRPERVQIEIANHHLPDLPVEMQTFIRKDENSPENLQRFLAGNTVWRKVEIEKWSLQTLHAPLYPQDRFQLGLAIWLAERYQLKENIRVIYQSPANRITGERTTRILNGRNAIQQAAMEFRLNAFPKDFVPQK